MQRSHSTFVRHLRSRNVLSATLFLPAVVGLAGCASGGGGGGTVPPTAPAPAPTIATPTPTPTVTPTPAPTPTPTGLTLPAQTASPSSFETSEYSLNVTQDNPDGSTSRFVSGLPFIGASTAYSYGATGQGQTIAVIDTGIDSTHPELVGVVQSVFDLYDGTNGRALRDSSDLDPEGHGTLVTGILAANKNDTASHGIAFDARIIDIRADEPDSCGSTDGCSFDDTDLSDAIDIAIAQNVGVINLSLGGEPLPDTVSFNPIRDAVERAAAAGIAVVASAGNGAAPASGNDPATGLSVEEPANVAGTTGAQGLVIAVGSHVTDGVSVTSDGQPLISSFSNRSGSNAQDFYILAPGEGIVTPGPDDDISNPGDPDNDADTIGEIYNFTGTSAAAPYVAGALVLLMETFPNITPAQAVQILLDTADDYIDTNLDPVTGLEAGVGPDAVSGVGVINLAAAFSPQGLSTVTFSNGTTTSLASVLAPSGGALGDWATSSAAFDGVVFQDQYNRGFSIETSNIAVDLLNGSLTSRIADLSARSDWMAGDHRQFSLGTTSFAYQVPRAFVDPVLPFYSDEPTASFQAEVRLAEGSVAFGRGGAMPRLAPEPRLINEPGMSNALTRDGAWASWSQSLSPNTMLDVFVSDDDRQSMSGTGITRFGSDWAVRGGVAISDDSQTALGGTLQSRFGLQDQSRLSTFSVEGAWARGVWLVSAGVEAGLADLPGLNVDNVLTSRWSVGAERTIGAGVASLTFAQPRRVETGTLTIETPSGIEATGTILFDQTGAELQPSGRELDVELGYRFALKGGWRAEAITAVSTSPNHIASQEDETATWFRMTRSW